MGKATPKSRVGVASAGADVALVPVSAASALRAKAAAKGDGRGHISVRGYGRSRPLVTSGPEGARKENRRVAIIVPAQ